MQSWAFGGFLMETNSLFRILNNNIEKLDSESILPAHSHSRSATNSFILHETFGINLRLM